MRVWDHLRRAGIRDWGRPWRRVKGRAEAGEAATTREGQAICMVDRQRFWAEFREGQRQAEASCLEADRVPKQDDRRRTARS